MCLAVPGRITRRDGSIARADFGGIERDVCMDLLPEAVVGDYVLVHAGFAIQRLPAREALEVYSLLRAAAEREDSP